MARGITQDHVNAAADAILATGENPTVEKVRAELGTGSPNTVTRMLDTWRGRLGERLRQLSTLPDIPDPVGQAMLGLWQLATEHAGRAIAERFSEERSELEAGRAALAAEHDAWTGRLEAGEIDRKRAQAAKVLTEHACATLDAQLHDSHALRADLVQQRDRLQAQCDQQLSDLQSLRKHIEDLQATLTGERTRQETYVRNLEDHAHREIDHARQESKQLQQRLDAAERAHNETQQSLRAEQQALREQIHRAETEVARYSGQVAGLEKSIAKHVAAKKKKAVAPTASRSRPTKRKSSTSQK